MNPQLAKILEAHPEAYPKHMQQQYARVLDKISDAWDTAALDDIFNELLVADHENRQGFPPEVAREILGLHVLYEHYKVNSLETNDPWAQERDMTVTQAVAFKASLEIQGVSFSPITLFKAVEKGMTRFSFDMLRAGMAIDVCRGDHWTPLMVALFNGHEETALMLLSRGASVEAKARHGYEALHWAVMKDLAEAVEHILKKGGNPNASTESGITPLLQAAMRNNVDIARLLLRNGAKVNAVDLDGWSPLHKACANGHLGMVKLLVDYGADSHKRSVSGTSALELALQSGTFEIIEALSPPQLAPVTVMSYPN